MRQTVAFRTVSCRFCTVRAHWSGIDPPPTLPRPICDSHALTLPYLDYFGLKSKKTSSFIARCDMICVCFLFDHELVFINSSFITKFFSWCANTPWLVCFSQSWRSSSSRFFPQSWQVIFCYLSAKRRDQVPFSILYTSILKCRNCLVS